MVPFTVIEDKVGLDPKFLIVMSVQDLINHLIEKQIALGCQQ